MCQQFLGGMIDTESMLVHCGAMTPSADFVSYLKREGHSLLEPYFVDALMLLNPDELSLL